MHIWRCGWSDCMDLGTARLISNNSTKTPFKLLNIQNNLHTSCKGFSIHCIALDCVQILETGRRHQLCSSHLENNTLDCRTHQFAYIKTITPWENLTGVWPTEVDPAHPLCLYIQCPPIGHLCFLCIHMQWFGYHSLLKLSYYPALLHTKQVYILTWFGCIHSFPDFYLHSAIQVWGSSLTRNVWHDLLYTLMISTIYSICSLALAPCSRSVWLRRYMAHEPLPSSFMWVLWLE